MLAIAAAVLFGIAWIIHVTETKVDAEIFGTTSLMLLGFTLFALHVAGVGSGWGAGWSRRRRR